MVLAYQAQGPATTPNVTQNYITADGILAYRDIYAKVFINFSSSLVLQKGFSRTLENMAREDVVQTNLIYHSEREDFYQNVTIASMVYVSGKQFRINYATASVDVIDGTYLSPGRTQDIILAADGQTRARIDDKVAPTGSTSGHYIIVSADTVTDVSSGPLQSAFMAKFTGGSGQIAFIGQSGAELGAFPDGTYQNYNIYGVEFQKLRDATSTWSMEASGQSLYVSVAGAPGGGNMPFGQSLGIMLERFEVARSIALLTGTGRTYTDIVTGQPAKEVMGLTTSTLTFGGSTTITNATAYTEETLQDVIRYVDSQGMGNVVFAQCGREAYFKIQDLMGAISGAQGIRFQYNGKEAPDFEFVSWQWGGKTWHFKLAPEFQTVGLLNAGNLQANYWPNTVCFYQMGAELPKKDDGSLGYSGSQQTKPFFSVKVYGQMQSGMAPGTFVKTKMVYRDDAILGTEANKVVCSQRFALQIQGVQKFYMIEGA